MLKHNDRVREAAQSEVDSENWRKKVDLEKEKIRNKKPWFGKGLWKAWMKLYNTPM